MGKSNNNMKGGKEMLEEQGRRNPSHHRRQGCQLGLETLIESQDTVLLLGLVAQIEEKVKLVQFGFFFCMFSQIWQPCSSLLDPHTTHNTSRHNEARSQH